ncbi:MAG: type II toxin-antitoxin system PemK/MazF family toxin [Acidimicrobiales bacterium]
MAGLGSLGRLKDKVRSSLRGRDQRGPGRSGDADATGGITVSYQPEHDGDADPGEVVWSWVPYEDDPSQGKDRPTLVLGHDGDLLAVVPLSSKDHSDRRDAGEWVPVGSGGWDSSGRPSYADASRVLRRSRLGSARGCGARPAPLRRVLARVGELHGWSLLTCGLSGGGRVSRCSEVVRHDEHRSRRSLGPARRTGSAGA